MSEIKVNKKYELVAPDGGWGYMICLAFIINNITIGMFIGSFGLIFNDFMKEIGIASTGTTILLGLYAVSVSLSGFFVSPIVKMLGLRKTTLVSAVIHNTGLIGMLFANSYGTFLICQGILPGIAFGLTYSTNCGIMNQYFVKRRLLAFSIAQTIVAAVTVLAPIFVKWSLAEYGFRGTLLLIAGICSHNILAVLLMQPVKWHLKRVEIVATPSSDLQPLIKGNIGNNATKLNENIGETEKNPKLDFDVEGESKQSRTSTLLDMEFFKHFIKSCVCMGPALSCFVEGTFMVFLPQALYAMGWDQGMVAFGVFLYCLGDVTMRVGLIFLHKWIHKIGSQETYILGLILATFAKLGFLWSEKEIAINVYLFVIGVARSFIYVLLTEVIADNVPADNFTHAIGIHMMSLGATTLILGPAIGATRDLTNSFDTAFYLLTSFFVFIILFWTIEIVYKRNKHKRQLQRETADELNKKRKLKKISKEQS